MEVYTPYVQNMAYTYTYYYCDGYGSDGESHLDSDNEYEIYHTNDNDEYQSFGSENLFELYYETYYETYSELEDSELEDSELEDSEDEIDLANEIIEDDGFDRINSEVQDEAIRNFREDDEYYDNYCMEEDPFFKMDGDIQDAAIRNFREDDQYYEDQYYEDQ